MRLWGLVTTMGEETTPAAIESLSPWVDGLIALVDEKAPPGFAESLGVRWHGFRWVDDYAAFYNAGADLLAPLCDWFVQLDADERLYDARNLRRVVQQAEGAGADAVEIPSRHFHDFGRMRECQNPSWFPDWHPRLRRPQLRMKGRVHQHLDGSPRTIRSTQLFVEHFNLAVRSPEDWRRVNAYYERLGAIPHPSTTPDDASRPDR